jgi:hypothetical protein
MSVLHAYAGTAVRCAEAAVDAIYDCMRVVGIASYTQDLAPLEKIMRDAMVFPLDDGATRACAAGSCTISSAIRAMTRCSPPAGKGCPKTSKADATADQPTSR